MHSGFTIFDEFTEMPTMLVLFFIVIIFHQSRQQSTIVLPTTYERISVEINSFTDIRSTNLVVQG